MLSNDQIRAVAEEIRRSADDRIHQRDDREPSQFLWESVRHACHVVEAIAELEQDSELSAADRRKRMQYVLSELETAVEVARQARKAARWREREQDD